MADDATHQSARYPMPVCQNCANDDRFVLTLDCNVPVDDRGFGSPDWTLFLQCADCDSADVRGDPVALLRAFS